MDDDLELGIWDLVARQHGVISRAQLLARDFTSRAIEHRIARGRLWPIRRGVYVVGRREVSRLGEMSAALLLCGKGAALSHSTAAELWGIRHRASGPLHVSVPNGRRIRRAGIEVHERALSPRQRLDEHQKLAVTPALLALVDIAPGLGRAQLERAVNVADGLDRIRADETLLEALAELPRLRGVRVIRNLLERDLFVLTESELESMFSRLVLRIGMPRPKTQARLGRHRCDFTWPELGLIVETDGLRYHRTALQQRRDAERDHSHLLAGRVSVRFTHWQVAHAPGHVLRTLGAAARRASALHSPRRSPVG